MTLKEWYRSNYHSNDDSEKLTEVLDTLDHRLKDLHQEGSFVVSFDPASIEVEDEEQLIATFLNVKQVSQEFHERKRQFPANNIDFKDFFDKYRQENIYMLAVLDVGLYLGVVDRLLNRDVLRDNFANYEYLLPPSRKDYYQHVIAYEKPDLYQDDFIDMKNGGNDKGKGEGLAKVLTTSHAKLYAESDDEMGHANALILLAFVILVFLLSVVGYLVFIRK